jgi:hypothetical protein
MWRVWSVKSYSYKIGLKKKGGPPDPLFATPFPSNLGGESTHSTLSTPPKKGVNPTLHTRLKKSKDQNTYMNNVKLFIYVSTRSTKRSNALCQ